MPKKQKDNRYRAKITVGHQSDGAPVFKYVSGRTKRELEDAKQAARAHYIDGQQAAKDQLFQERAISWFEVHKKPFISISTRNDYAAVYNNYLLPAFSGRMLRAIHPTDLQQWLNTFEGKSKTRTTLALTVLRGIFGAAYREGILERDPSTHLIKPEATPPRKKCGLPDSVDREKREKASENGRRAGKPGHYAGI